MTAWLREGEVRGRGRDGKAGGEMGEDATRERYMKAAQRRRGLERSGWRRSSRDSEEEGEGGTLGFWRSGEGDAKAGRN